MFQKIFEETLEVSDLTYSLPRMKQLLVCLEAVQGLNLQQNKSVAMDVEIMRNRVNTIVKKEEATRREREEQQREQEEARRKKEERERREREEEERAKKAKREEREKRRAARKAEREQLM